MKIKIEISLSATGREQLDRLLEIANADDLDTARLFVQSEAEQLICGYLEDNGLTFTRTMAGETVTYGRKIV